MLVISPPSVILLDFIRNNKQPPSDIKYQQTQKRYNNLVCRKFPSISSIEMPQTQNICRSIFGKPLMMKWSSFVFVMIMLRDVKRIERHGQHELLQSQQNILILNKLIIEFWWNSYLHLSCGGEIITSIKLTTYSISSLRPKGGSVWVTLSVQSTLWESDDFMKIFWIWVNSRWRF